MSTHNIYFCGEIRKLFTCYSRSGAMTTIVFLGLMRNVQVLLAIAGFAMPNSVTETHYKYTYNVLICSILIQR